ncbi:MAG: hypothetical protein DRZ82_10035 [Thermoprotei archaeon]|nr:MAG: hypothetical protein DRZ82_10035 [Thermoprotei archaeon]
MRIDIKGFARSLSIDAYGASYEVVVKYVLGMFLKFLHRHKDAAPWVELFREVLRAKRFLLIVLDGARYDVFRRMYRRYLRGILCKAFVPPPHTYGWLPKAFSLPEFDHVRVFYASLGIVTHDIRIKDFIPRGRDVEIYVVKPSKLKEIGTVLPFEVNNVVRRVGLRGRDIVWYVQPHFPWVCDPELSLMLMRDVLIHDYVPPDTVRRTLKKYGISRERVLRAYCCNMEVALRGVRDLLEYIHTVGLKYDRIVVTSDHGELLGEYGLYLHQEYDLPQLTVVPWLEVEL